MLTFDFSDIENNKVLLLKNKYYEICHKFEMALFGKSWKIKAGSYLYKIIAESTAGPIIWCKSNYIYDVINVWPVEYDSSLKSYEATAVSADFKLSLSTLNGKNKIELESL